MAVAEFPMWVTKRYPALGNKTGFVMVPRGQRAPLIADGGAQDTFSGLSFITPAPPITDIAFHQYPLDTDAVVGELAGLLTVDGGTEPFEFGLTGTDAGYFTATADEVRTAVAPLAARVYSMFITASDAAGRRYVDPMTVTVTAVAPPAVARTAPAPKAGKK